MANTLLGSSPVQVGDYITLVHREGPPNHGAPVTMQVEEVREGRVIGTLALHRPDSWDLPPGPGEVIRDATPAEIQRYKNRRQSHDHGCAACGSKPCRCSD